VVSRPAARSASVPRQPEPEKTVLIISSLTPKSLRVSTGRPTAMASRAAVEETVTSPRAPARASVIDPAAKCSASASSRPAWTRPAYSCG
jgi:hypothetical protein